MQYAVKERDRLRIDERRRETQNFTIDLMKLTEAAPLRFFGAEDGAAAPEFDGGGARVHPVLEVRAQQPRRKLGPERQAALHPRR